MIVVGAAALIVAIGLVGAIIALAGLGQASGDLALERVPAWFWYYRGDPRVTRWLAIGLGSSALVALLCVATAVLAVRRPLHGAARWASAADQRRAGLRAHQGVILGRTGDGFLIADGPEHVMLYAPTRTGKGVGVVIPNLLAWPGSVVVLDVKRENFLATAGFREAAGQKVFLFDPLAPDGRTARYNPLGHVDRDDAVAVVDELQRMAAMLFPGHDHADPFWSEAARTGFIGVGGYVAAARELPFTLGEVFRQLTMGEPRERLSRLASTRTRSDIPLSAPVAAALRDFTHASENTFSSVRQSITTRMGLWLNPQVDAATSSSDFDLRELRRGQTSIYLGASPDNLLRVQPLYALLFQQLCDLNSRALPGSDDQTVLVVLDEFARLGRAPVLAHAFAWVAGFGLRLLPVIQSPSQLRAIYGSDVAEEILSNCGIEVVYAPKELKVAQDLSERLGAYTYAGLSRSRPAGLASGRRSVTTSDQRRPLMLPQELMQLPSGTLIVLKAGVPPTRGRKIKYYDDRTFTARLRPAPEIPTSPLSPAALDTPLPVEEDAMDFDTLARAFTSEGLPPPPEGSEEVAVSTWLDRVVDRAIEERAP